MKVRMKLTESLNPNMEPVALEILKKVKFHTGLFFYYFWAKNIQVYIEEQNSGKYPDTPAVNYEDLVSNPRDSTHVILAHCGLAPELVERAMRGFESDSQAGTVLGRQEVAQHTDTTLLESPETKRDIAKLSQALGLARHDEDIRLPHTITSAAPR